MPIHTFRTPRRVALVTVASLLMLAAAPAGALTDGHTHIQKPPTTGAYAYGVYGPNETAFPKVGAIYGGTGDPRFGGNVRRITSEFPNPSRSDIYSKNGFWSADGRLMYHLSALETNTVINTVTGAGVEVPGDYQGFDGSFAPNDPAGGPYTWYFFSGTKLMAHSISIAADGTPVVAGPAVAVQDLGVTVGGLGGSVDWIDNSGRYMVLNIGGALKVWDNVARTFYVNPTPAPVNADAVVARGGWIGISPDARYVVVSTDDGTGNAGNDQQWSYEVDHSTGTVGAGKLFWTLCGGHGDLVSAGDGHTYLVTFDCYGKAAGPAFPAIYAVNVAPSTPVTGNDPADEVGRDAQRSSNKKLFELAWGDDGHFSGVSTGALRNWAFISVESGEDTFARPLDATTRSPAWWTRPYMQEIVMVNVVTCQVVRVAHHRSRSVSDSYYYQPRVSASWDGTTAAWLSNFGQLQMSEQGRLSTTPYAGYADVYAIDVSPADLPPTARVCLP